MTVQQLVATHQLHTGVYHIKVATGIVTDRWDITDDSYIVLELGRRNKLLGITLSVAWPPPHLQWKEKRNSTVGVRKPALQKCQLQENIVASGVIGADQRHGSTDR